MRRSRSCIGTRRPGPPLGRCSTRTGGYEATFGRYEVDPDARTFTYYVEGGLVGSLIDKKLVRSFELSGNQLIVKSSNSDETGRVAWEHY